MSKLINKTQGFTIVNSEITRDARLGITERGLLLTLLSLPDNWEYSVLGLTKILPKDGKAKIRAATQKLEELGYLTRTPAKDEKGRFAGYDWEVSSVPTIKTDDICPLSENRTTDEKTTPLSENRSTENRSTEKPSSENQPQLNNNKLNNQQLSIYESINLSDEMDENAAQSMVEKLKDNLDYDICKNHRPELFEFFNSCFKLIVDTVLSSSKTTRIGKEDIATCRVKERLMALELEHIEYVQECFDENAKDIKNTKNYLLTALYNAPTTIDAYYQQKVNTRMQKK